MDFEFDSFNNPLETAHTENRTRSEDEIKKWSTEENLGEVRRAIFLLSRGFDQQKLACLGKLDKILEEHLSERVLPYIFPQIPTWEDSLQIEAGKSLARALSKNVFPIEHLNELTEICCSVLSLWIEEVHEAWVPLFAEIVNASSLEYINSHLVQVTLKLSDYSQPVGVRCSSAGMVAAIAQKLQTEFPESLIRKSLMLAKDPEHKVRQSICKHLHNLCRAVGEDITQKKYFDEIANLAEDERPPVRAEAIKVVVELVDMMSYGSIVASIVPVLTKELKDPSSNLVKNALAEKLGLMVVKMEAELKEQEFREACLEFFTKLLDEEDPSLRKKFPFNFPAVLVTFGANEFTQNLGRLWNSVCEDTDSELRRIAASSIHEVAKILGNKSILLKSSFEKLLESQEVWVLLEKIGVWIVSCESLESFTEKLPRLFEKATSWRKSMLLLQSIISLINNIPIQTLIQKLLPEIYKVRNQSVKVKEKAAETLANIFKVVYLQEKKLELVSNFQTYLNSKLSNDRSFYLELCKKLRSVCTRKFFNEHFFELALKLAEDPVAEVRAKFAETVPKLRKSVEEGDKETPRLLNALLDQLSSEENRVVSITAARAQVELMSPEYLLKLRNQEHKENAKRKLEEEQAQRQLKEAEESKRRLVEEITANNRKNRSINPKLQVSNSRLTGSVSPNGFKTEKRQASKFFKPGSFTSVRSSIIRTRRTSPTPRIKRK